MKIAIVEDIIQHRETLKNYLERYEQEMGVCFDVHVFSNGLDFLDSYKNAFDIIFMDIDMPHINGIETAKRLREIDRHACLVFVTELSQFAINGYEVDAFDFIVKPVDYEKFHSRLTRAIATVNKNNLGKLCIKNKNEIRVVQISDIYYVENIDHKIVYHLVDGDIETWESLSKVEKMLPSKHFARCSTSYLVNLSHVISVKGNTVTLPKTTLPITRLKKKEFMDKFMQFVQI